MQRNFTRKSIGGIVPSRNTLFTVETDAQANINLAKIADDLAILLEKYYEQDLAYLETHLKDTSSTYRLLVKNISNMTVPKNIMFNIKTFFFNILDGLRQSVKAAQICKQTSNRNKELEEKVVIMDDYNKLKEYLEQMYEQLTRTITVFEFKPITSLIPVINPKYIKYYELYGRPVNGVFKAELMYNVERLLDNERK